MVTPVLMVVMRWRTVLMTGGEVRVVMVVMRWKKIRSGWLQKSGGWGAVDGDHGGPPARPPEGGGVGAGPHVGAADGDHRSQGVVTNY